MPKFQKRKAPVDSSSTQAVKRSQLLKSYSPFIRSRAHKLSKLKFQLMCDTFLPNNNILWECTSNCKVVNHKKNGFFVRLLYRKRPENKKGERKSSIMYDTGIEAENNAFQFRYKYENTSCKKCIDEYKTNLISILAGSEPNPITTHISLAKKTKPLSPANIRSYAMSGSLLPNKRAHKSMNPNTCIPNSSMSIYPTHEEFAATRIQKLLKNRDIRRSAKQMKKTVTDQSYRRGLIKHLSHFINTNTCHLLLLGSEGPEIWKSYSQFDKRHASIKARHITDALICLHRATANETAINRIQCCELAIEKNYNTVKRARTVADWYCEIHQTQNLQFRCSQRGRDSSAAKSPFAEDESLLIQMNHECVKILNT